jgi:hypothetical protein
LGIGAATVISDPFSVPIIECIYSGPIRVEVQIKMDKNAPQMGWTDHGHIWTNKQRTHIKKLPLTNNKKRKLIIIKSKDQ